MGIESNKGLPNKREVKPDKSDSAKKEDFSNEVNGSLNPLRNEDDPKAIIFDAQNASTEDLKKAYDVLLKEDPKILLVEFHNLKEFLKNPEEKLQEIVEAASKTGPQIVFKYRKMFIDESYAPSVFLSVMRTLPENTGLLHVVNILLDESPKTLTEMLGEFTDFEADGAKSSIIRKVAKSRDEIYKYEMGAISGLTPDDPDKMKLIEAYAEKFPFHMADSLEYLKTSDNFPKLKEIVVGKLKKAYSNFGPRRSSIQYEANAFKYLSAHKEVSSFDDKGEIFNQVFEDPSGLIEMVEAIAKGDLKIPEEELEGAISNGADLLIKLITKERKSSDYRKAKEAKVPFKTVEAGSYVSSWGGHMEVRRRTIEASLKEDFNFDLDGPDPKEQNTNAYRGHKLFEKVYAAIRKGELID